MDKFISEAESAAGQFEGQGQQGQQSQQDNSNDNQQNNQQGGQQQQQQQQKSGGSSFLGGAMQAGEDGAINTGEFLFSPKVA
jgi:hypothetical protein